MTSPIDPYLTYEFTPVGNKALQHRLRWLMLACAVSFATFLLCTGTLILSALDSLKPSNIPQGWLVTITAILAVTFLAATGWLIRDAEKTRTQLAKLIAGQIDDELARWQRTGSDHWLVHRLVWINGALNLWLLAPNGTPTGSRLRIEHADDDLIRHPGLGTHPSLRTVRFGRVWHVRYGDALEWLWRPRPVRVCFLGPIILYQPSLTGSD